MVNEKCGSISEDSEKTSLRGVELLTNPLYNKGTAFTRKEREELGLLGLLPPHIDDINGQINRAYQAFQMEPTALEKHIFLRNLQDHNEVLFYRLLMEHIPEMMPIIYTPVVGEACQKFSHIFRQRRGLYISYPDRKQIRSILDNSYRQNIKVIVVTDGERILGLGDQGTDGMGIPIGKLSLYSLCGGIDPASTLPVILDVGTDNQERLEDPLYIGWRNKRIRDKRYDQFVDDFVSTVKEKFPHVLLQWEDFANRNARRLLDKYKDELCTFNDDIQGTAAVAVAAIMSALKVVSQEEVKQNYVIFGAGSAGVGVAELLVESLLDKGLSEREACGRIWLVDRYGLIHSETESVQDVQKPYQKNLDSIRNNFALSGSEIGLEETIRISGASVLLGTSGQKGSFTKDVVSAMLSNTNRPIIFPLSNPTNCCEAEPENIIAWSSGAALVATGSPFPSVDFNGTSIVIGQCNNCYVFPGIGLGVIASGASRVTDSMFMKASRALSELSPALTRDGASLLPELNSIREVSLKIASAVAKEASRLNINNLDVGENLEEKIEAIMWKPKYKNYTI